MTPSFIAWTETTLGGINFLEGVPEDVLLELGSRAEWCNYPVGQRLLAGPHARGWLLFLTAGLVKVRMATGERYEYGPGVCLGLRRAFAKTCPAFRAVSTAPATVGWLQRDELCDVMTRSPELALAVGKELGVRAFDMLPRTDDRHGLDEHVAQALIVHAHPHLRPNGVATLPALPDPSLWAALARVGDADVQRSFARLERAGLIRTVAGERLYVEVARLRDWLDQRRNGT